jgi:hypothetical protein
MSQRKNPVVAGWLNLIPGVGLMYAGRWRLGILTLIMFPVVVVLFVYLGGLLVRLASSLLPSTYAPIGVGLFFVVIAILILRSLYIEGSRAAIEYNEKHGLQQDVSPAQPNARDVGGPESTPKP